MIGRFANERKSLLGSRSPYRSVCQTKILNGLQSPVKADAVRHGLIAKNQPHSCSCWRTARSIACSARSIQSRYFRRLERYRTEPRWVGFVQNYLAQQQLNPQQTYDPKSVMHYFAPAQVPALSQLAQKFAVCDHWFASA